MAGRNPAERHGAGRKAPAGPSSGRRRGGGNKTARADHPRGSGDPGRGAAGSRFKGYQSFVVQDLVLRAHVLRLRRERWLTPDGQRITAPLPAGMVGHFGPDLRRFVLAQYHQGQATVARLVAQLRASAIDISQRQVMRPADRWPGRLPRGGPRRAAGGAGDGALDLGRRHRGAPRRRERILHPDRQQDFTWFGTSRSKSRLNFLGLLRAGHADLRHQRCGAGLSA